MQGIEISVINVGTRRDIALFRVKGYIDTQTCTEMLTKITSVLQKGTFHLIVDMSQVNYVSSAGWGVFVGEIKGIRENGGDLKIVEMTPEVYDVFEMLEFNRILEYYDSLEEAIDDFDLSIGLDLTKSLAQSYSPAELTTGEVAVLDLPKSAARVREVDGSRNKSRPSFNKSKIDERALPVSEKIKLIIIDNPSLGLFKIRQALNSERFGFVHVNWWQLYQMLRKINLDTREKRFRFYRSR
ncbi:MAG: STAS domain-containing protein [bacterium]